MPRNVNASTPVASRRRCCVPRAQDKSAKSPRRLPYHLSHCVLIASQFIPRHSFVRFLAELFEARVAAEWIEVGIETQEGPRQITGDFQKTFQGRYGVVAIAKAGLEPAFEQVFDAVPANAEMVGDGLDGHVRQQVESVAFEGVAEAAERAGKTDGCLANPTTLATTEPRHGQAQLDGLVNSVDGVLQISVDGAPTRLGDALDLDVYRFEIELVPPPGATATIQFALGQNQRIVAQWGES